MKFNAQNGEKNENDGSSGEESQELANLEASFSPEDEMKGEIDGFTEVADILQNKSVSGN